MVVHPLLKCFSMYQQAPLPSSQQNPFFETNTYDPRDWARICSEILQNL